jgi:hypothetical protein
MATWQRLYQAFLGFWGCLLVSLLLMTALLLLLLLQ